MPPKILILPSFYPMEMDFPRGNFFQEQTEMLVQNGVNATVLFNESRSIRSFTIKKFRLAHFQTTYGIENNVPVFRKRGWNIIPTKFKLGSKIWIYNSIKLFEHYINNYGKPDIIHAHCAQNAGMVALHIKRKYNIPYLITEHSTAYALKPLSVELKSAINEVYSNAFKVIAVSTEFQKLLANKLSLPVNLFEVIPNFIDTNYFQNTAIGDSSQLPYLTIFTVCYHERKKRIDRLIEAFHNICQQVANVKLVIGGVGPETSRLQAQVKRLNLDSKISFSGFLTKEQVKDQLSKTSIFVLPSDVETFGVVLIEAMAMGVPVISTRSGGPEDIISPETGILVEKTSEDLQKAILHLIANKSQFDSVKIRRRILDNYSGKAVADQYKLIYNNAFSALLNFESTRN
ncbi:glycosyltransferase [Dyadobacter tibetensis]|uniref:glycosyltransferase n=1 Tax=Dyadobacter tibetensis TaxID=1211851 RepID=UPI0004BA07F8|nr:glycosyltransferase [Dyadobacter tibetensis]